MASQSPQDATKLLINAATTQVGARSLGNPTDADGNDRKIAAKEAATSYDHVPIELPPSMHESTHKLASLYTFIDAYIANHGFDNPAALAAFIAKEFRDANTGRVRFPRGPTGSGTYTAQVRNLTATVADILPDQTQNLEDKGT